MNNKFSRRDFLKLGGMAAIIGSASGTVFARTNQPSLSNNPLADICGVPPVQKGMDHSEGLPGTGDVDHKKKRL